MSAHDRRDRRARWVRRLFRRGPAPTWVRRWAWDRPDWPGGAGLATIFSFDVDYEEDEAALPEVLAALAAVGAKGTFACIGKHVEARPERYRPIVEGGHEVLHHSYAHPYHRLLTPDRRWPGLTREEIRSDLDRGEGVFASALGIRPVGFRTPHFEQNPATPEVLAERGYLYDSSGYRSEGEGSGAIPFFQSGVLQFPIHRDVSTYAVLRGGGSTAAQWVAQVVRRLGDEAAAGGLAHFYFDPRDLASCLREFGTVLAAARSAGAWVARLDEVARRLIQESEP